MRQYNCMSEDHCSEVDARIHDIEEVHDHYVMDDMHYYVAIRDIVTRYVELHHALLQEAGNILVRAIMPKDAVKHVLSFL